MQQLNVSPWCACAVSWLRKRAEMLPALTRTCGCCPCLTMQLLLNISHASPHCAAGAGAVKADHCAAVDHKGG